MRAGFTFAGLLAGDSSSVVSPEKTVWSPGPRPLLGRCPIAVSSAPSPALLDRRRSRRCLSPLGGRPADSAAAAAAARAGPGTVAVVRGGRKLLVVPSSLSFSTRWSKPGAALPRYRAKEQTGT